MSSGEIAYDWLQPEPNILVEMILADNPTRELTVSMVTFSNVSPYTPGEGETYNSTVSVSSTPTAPFSGTQTHYYHRVDINAFVKETTSLTFSVDVVLDKPSFTTALGNRLGVYLTEDKLLYTPTTDSGPLEVMISDHSLCYLGTLIVLVEGGATPLDSIITKPHLSGFDS